jgi:formylmethanofuran dehydrogenase subunit E
MKLPKTIVKCIFCEELLPRISAIWEKGKSLCSRCAADLKRKLKSKTFIERDDD